MQNEQLHSVIQKTFSRSKAIQIFKIINVWYSHRIRVISTIIHESSKMQNEQLHIVILQKNKTKKTFSRSKAIANIQNHQCL